MPEDIYLRGSRRRPQKKGPHGLVTLVVVLAAGVLLASGAYFWMSGKSRGSASVESTSTPAAALAKKESSSAVSVAPTATSEPTSSAVATAGAVDGQTDPEALSAAEISVRAAQKAAVDFPGAPGLSSSSKSISELHPKHKYVAITLDDGYNFNPQMLELFEQYDVKCTTFLIGSWAAENKPAVKKMRDAGFEIANHSWSHPFLSHLSSDQIASELTRTQRVISSITGNQAPYMRPPYGATNSTVKATAARLGYRVVLWNKSFGDSGRGATPKKLYSNVMERHGGIQPGDIILCHWGSRPTYEALKKILPELRAQGYEFVTLSALIADSKR